MRATEFDGFSGKVIPGRWAMIADCSLQMAVVEVSLRWGWVLEKYQGKEIKAREPAEDIDADSDDEWTKKKLNLPLADAGINDEFHWGWFVMFREVCGTILMAFQWLSGCSCHPHVNHKDVPNSLKGVWEKCPFRGRRAPELAIFLNALHDWFRSLFCYVWLVSVVAGGGGCFSYLFIHLE